MSGVIEFAYIFASILFVFGLKMLGSASTARRGNMVSAIGMRIAVVATLFEAGMSFQYILIGVVIRFGFDSMGWKAILCLWFIAMTSPTAAHTPPTT